MSASLPSYPSQGSPAPQPALRAPEGTEPSTPWIWLLVVLPVVEILISIPLLLSVGDVMSRMVGMASTGAAASDSSEVLREMLSAYAGILGPMLWVMLAGYLLSGIGVLLGWLDWRELRRRGVPKPFHWAWGFFVFAGGGILVTLIGRSVVIRRRTGRGLAPLWAGIAAYVVVFVATIVWVVYFVTSLIGSISVR